MKYILKKDGKDYPITLRIYRQGDYSMYLQCIKAFYQEGYPYKEYLDENYIQQKIEQGKLIITVGENGEGQIISVLAATLQKSRFSNTILLMLRNVLPEYSGISLASKQLDYLITLLPQYYPDAESVYADVMTYNGNSQHSVASRGYVLCGIRFMLYKSEIIVPNLIYEENIKMSQTVYCLNLKKGIKKKVYVPKEHKEIIHSMYKQLEVEVEMHTMDEVADFFENENIQKENDWQVMTVKEHEKTEWIINSLADDYQEELDFQFAQYEKMPNRTAIVYINMCDESSEKAWNYFLEKGFYFSGIKPLNKEGEYIMMSHTMYCNEQYQTIVLDEKGESLLQYILEKKHRR